MCGVQSIGIVYRKFCAGFLFSFIAFFNFTLEVEAQTYVQAFDAAHIITGSQDFDKLGAAVAGGGDVNGDGYDDFIIGAPGLVDIGRVIVVSGLNGQIIWEVFADYGNGGFGVAVANAGDVDGDGLDDVIIGDPRDEDLGTNSGFARVYSGADARILYDFRCSGEERTKCGQAVSGNCDLNADQVPDVIVGALESAGSGEVFVYSGHDGSLIHRLTGENFADQFGHSVSCLGDANSDGYDDIIVGAWGVDTGGSQAGAAYVFSGADASTLYKFHGDESDEFGWSVSLVGDVNADGYDDFAVGAPQASLAGGYAEVYSGFDGSLLHRFQAETTGNNFGRALSYLGDIDADGHFDILVGDPTFNQAQGRAYVFSGKTGSLQFVFEGETTPSTGDFGASLFAAGDANADGAPDIIIGSPSNSAARVLNGRAYLFYSPSPTPSPDPDPSPEPDPDPAPDPDEEPAPQIDFKNIYDVIEFLDEYFPSRSWEDIEILLKHWVNTKLEAYGVTHQFRFKFEVEEKNRGKSYWKFDWRKLRWIKHQKEKEPELQLNINVKARSRSSDK